MFHLSFYLTSCFPLIDAIQWRLHLRLDILFAHFAYTELSKTLTCQLSSSVSTPPTHTKATVSTGYLQRRLSGQTSEEFSLSTSSFGLLYDILFALNFLRPDFVSLGILRHFVCTELFLKTCFTCHLVHHLTYTHHVITENFQLGPATEKIIRPKQWRPQPTKIRYQNVFKKHHHCFLQIKSQ